ncbi:MAG: M48 family metallopeptidase, partial [Tidjanibacter sp.]|nr:M48 family metallopeptidase [Tidjanibacter sp.]
EGNISLSLYLAALPDELIDFVCVHELCHRIHPNHSADFHALVDRHLGGREKELNAQLRNYRPGQKGQ